MIMDKQLLFSDAQSVTATANATNVLDLGEGKVGGTVIRLFAKAEADSTHTTGTIKLTVKTSAESANMANSVTLFETPAMNAAQQLNANFVLPQHCNRYVQLAYTMANSAAMNITAGLVADAEADI